MTCIIGYKTDKGLIYASDSRISCGNDIHRSARLYGLRRTKRKTEQLIKELENND